MSHVAVDVTRQLPVKHPRGDHDDEQPEDDALDAVLSEDHTAARAGDAFEVHHLVALGALVQDHVRTSAVDVIGEHFRSHCQGASTKFNYATSRPRLPRSCGFFPGPAASALPKVPLRNAMIPIPPANIREDLLAQLRQAN